MIKEKYDSHLFSEKINIVKIIVKIKDFLIENILIDIFNQQQNENKVQKYKSTDQDEHCIYLEINTTVLIIKLIYYFQLGV